MSYNTREGFEAMQEDAIRRVRDMQMRANRYVKNSEEFIKAEEKTAQQPEPKTVASQNNSNINHTANQAVNHSDNSPNRNNNQQNTHTQNRPNNMPNSFQGNMGQRPNILQSLFQGPLSNGFSQQKSQQQNNNSPKGLLSPLAQLFGSNLGGFNKAKSQPKSNKPDLFPDSPDDDGKTKSFIENLLKEFNIDQEKLMLILLIYVLYKNGSDFKLIAALGYLLI